MPDVTLVVPAYNEEVLLPILLESVQVSVNEWAHGSAAVEVVVANNCSTDRTSEVALRFGAKVVDVSSRGIGAARNGGAAVAQGEILCFVDADSRIHPQTFCAIAAALDQPDVGGGATGVIPEHWSAALHVLSAMTLPARIMGIDSGVVFCRRADFTAVRGYRNDLLVGEDVEFLWRLKLHARRQNRDLIRLKHVEAITSTRKFDKYGHWRFLAALAALAFHRLVSPKRFLRQVQRYWYENR